MSKKAKIILVAIVGALGQSFNALSGHSLSDVLSAHMLQIFKTGAKYHLIYSVVLLIFALMDKKEYDLPFYLFFTGIVLFSVSLYLFAFVGKSFIIWFTPIGGIFFIAGWLSLIYVAIKNNKE